METSFIEVLVTSASRPKLLKRTMGSFFNNIKTKRPKRLILHEDVVSAEKSMQILCEFGCTKFFDQAIITSPAMRLSHAIKRGMEHIEKDLFIKWEDDWELLQEIDVDEIISIMERHKHINQIGFNKNMNRPHKHDLFMPEENFGKFKITLSHEWLMGPGIWRKSFIYPKWVVDGYYDMINAHLPVQELWENKDVIGMQEKIGAYYYGGHNEGPFIRHLGDNQSSWFSPVGD